MKKLCLVVTLVVMWCSYWTLPLEAASGEASAIMRLLVKKGVVSQEEADDFLDELDMEHEADKVEVKIEMTEDLQEEGVPLNSGGRYQVYGSVDVVGYLQSNTSFTKDSTVSFAENVAKLGVRANVTEQASTDFRIVAANTSGDDNPLFDTSTDDVKVYIDLANLKINDLFGYPIDLLLGRQEILFGDGFIIGDGRNDAVAQWSYPLKSFDAARATWEDGPYTVDLFGAFLDNDWKQWVGSYDAGPPIYQDQLATTAYSGGGQLYGTNFHYEGEDKGIWDIGVFFRNDESELHNDTLAFSLRGSYDVAIVPGLNIEGEAVQQIGRTKLNGAELLTDEEIRRDALGGHLDATYTFEGAPMTPYVRTSYIYLPGDNIETPGQNEAFDPLFFDWTDWGKWYIGNIVGGQGQIMNSNQRVTMLEAGIVPNSSTSLRVQFFNIQLDQGLNTDFSLTNYANEINVIFDYWPNEIYYWGASVGMAHPLEAAKYWNANGDTGEEADENTYEFLVWAGVEF